MAAGAQPALLSWALEALLNWDSLALQANIDFLFFSGFIIS